MMVAGEPESRNYGIAAPTVGRVQREILISASPGRVWEALIDQRQLSAWFGAEVVLEARAGGRASFRWPDGRERAALVELVDPRRRLILRWSPFVRLPTGGNSLVGPGRVDLIVRSVEGGTLVKVVEEYPGDLAKASVGGLL